LILMECERHGLCSYESDLLHILGQGFLIATKCDISSETLLCSAVSTAAVTRFLAALRQEEAAALLQSLAHRKLWNPAADVLLAQLECATRPFLGTQDSVVLGEVPFASFKLKHAKYIQELSMLSFVLEHAVSSGPESVCEAVDQFGRDVLAPAGAWSKVAGSAKADILIAALNQAPHGSDALEIGTYCGYTAIKMAASMPGLFVDTIEVDPVHVVIARNLIALAGLSKRVHVWTGHSKHVLPHMADRHPLKTQLYYGTVFMDRWGSQYQDDLDVLEQQELLAPSSIVVADNVLWTGACLFLWRVSATGLYNTTIVQVQEFTTTSEDWMSVSVRHPPLHASRAENTALGAADYPEELQQLHLEAEQMRERVLGGTASVSPSEREAFMMKVKNGLQRAGIFSVAGSSRLLR